MLNIAVQASRIAVLAILISQPDLVLAQHCKDGSCCLKSHSGQDQLSAPTPRRSPFLNLRNPQLIDESGESRDSRSRLDGTQPGRLPSSDLTLQDQYQPRPTRYPAPRSTIRPAARPVSLAGPVWEVDLKKAASIARETGRPMLIQVTASWCGYCRKMKSEVFPQPRIQRDLALGFVTVEMDADKNRELVQRLGIKSLPTTLILTPDMQIAERMEGFRSAQQLQEKLNRFLPRAELNREIELALR